MSSRTSNAELCRPSTAQRRSRLVPRVGHVLSWQGIGGAQIATLRLIKALDEAGNFCGTAFCTSDDPDTVCMLRNAGVDVLWYPATPYSYRRGVSFVKGAIRLALELRRRAIDIVHCADPMGLTHAGLAAKLLGLPVVSHVRSEVSPVDIWHVPPLLAADRFIFVSRATWQQFERVMRVPPHRGTVIYDWAPAVSRSHAAATTGVQIRRELGIELGAPLVGMVARIAAPKDFRTLLLAMAHVVPMYPEVHLILVGAYQVSGGHQREYESVCQLVKELNLGGHVTLAGFRTDVSDLMCAMDIVVLCTKSEGFPLALLEAMALGRPIAATSVGGVPEMITHGDTGLLHQSGDADQLATHLLLLLRKRDLAARLGERARERARTAFPQNASVEAVQRVYCDVHANRRRLKWR